MSLVLPLNFQSLDALQNVSGTSQARLDNQQRLAIEAPSQTQAYPSSDKVSISDEAKQAAKAEDDEETSLELSEEEEKEVQTLKDRDQEVRIHEQAHAAVGGQYAGAPTYEYETGPDGRRYAVAGEVQIDVGEESTPEDTIEKMQIVKAAALAPAEPSTQDIKVAAEATQKEQQARAELSEKGLSGGSQSNDKTKVFQDIQAYSESPAFTAFA